MFKAFTNEDSKTEWDHAELRRMFNQVKRYRKDISIERATTFQAIECSFEAWKKSQDDCDWAILLSVCDLYAREEKIIFYHKLEQGRYPPERKDKVWEIYCSTQSDYHNEFESARIKWLDQLEAAKKQEEKMIRTKERLEAARRNAERKYAKAQEKLNEQVQRQEMLERIFYNDDMEE